jgi:hypothetical protein
MALLLLREPWSPRAFEKVGLRGERDVIRTQTQTQEDGWSGHVVRELTGKCVQTLDPEARKKE